MLLKSLLFVVLTPDGPKLTREAPSDLRVYRAWNAWWTASDHPPGAKWPPLSLMRQIGEDFTARESGDYGIMGVIECGNVSQNTNAERFVAGYGQVTQPQQPRCQGTCGQAGCSLIQVVH